MQAAPSPTESAMEIPTRRMSEQPMGYPSLAAFQSSESNFSIYRSYSYLHSRILLELQDELVQLEKQLENLDSEHEMMGQSSDVEDTYGMRSVPRHVKRSETLEVIRECLVQYDKTLLAARHLGQFQTPLERRQFRRLNSGFGGRDGVDYRSDDIASVQSGRRWGDSETVPSPSMSRQRGMYNITATYLASCLPTATAAAIAAPDSILPPTSLLRDPTTFDYVGWGLFPPALAALWYGGAVTVGPSYVGMLSMACLWAAEVDTSSLRDIRTTTLQIWAPLAANYVIRDCFHARHPEQHVLKYIVLFSLFSLLGSALQAASEDSFVKVIPPAVALAAVVLSFVPKKVEDKPSPAQHALDRAERGLVARVEGLANPDDFDLESLRSDGDVGAARS